MEKLDFAPKNVINCVDNEPALWDTEFTDVHPEITARINSYHWLSFLWSVSVSSTWPLSLRHLNCTPRLQYMQRLFRLRHPFCEK